jgi:F-type H+-transporting ATPase subunit b
MEILRQLGELFLGAAPTIIVVLLFYYFLRWAFFTPILKAMAERGARIEGARAEAAKVEAEAKHEMDAYHEALRPGRRRSTIAPKC